MKTNWMSEKKYRLAIPGLFFALAFALVMAMPAGTHAADAAKGETLFKAKCAMCHGPDGKGETKMGKMLKLKDLGSPEVQKLKDSEIQDIIEKGKKPMPAYGDKLKKEEIDDLVAHIRDLGKKK